MPLRAWTTTCSRRPTPAQIRELIHKESWKTSNSIAAAAALASFGFSTADYNYGTDTSCIADNVMTRWPG